MTSSTSINGQFLLGGERPINRLGFGAMRLPTNGFRGPARDPATGRAVLRRAVELGVNLIDTADFYQSSDGSVRANDLIREAPAGSGYVVAVGETVYRALDAVIKLGERGVKVNLVNKATVNVVDVAMMKKLAAAPFVLVVEGWNVKTGLGSRFGSYLLQAGFKGRYNHIGTHKEGSGGLWQQMGYQGLDPKGIAAAIEALAT